MATIKTITGMKATETGVPDMITFGFSTRPLQDTFQQALRIIHTSPSLHLTATKIARYQKKSAEIRQEFEQ